MKLAREHAAVQAENERQREIKLNLIRQKAAYKAKQNGQNPESAANQAERDFLRSCKVEQAKCAARNAEEAERSEAEFEVVKQQQAKRQFKRRGSVHEMQDFMVGHKEKTEVTQKEIRQSFENVSELQANIDTRQSKLGGRLVDAQSNLADQAKVLAIFDQMKQLADANKRHSNLSRSAQLLVKWARKAKTRKMIEAMKRRLHLMGYPQRWSQYIAMDLSESLAPHTRFGYKGMLKTRSQPLSPTSTTRSRQSNGGIIAGKAGRTATLTDATNSPLNLKVSQSPIRHRRGLR
jgi:hypothetical protein